MKYFLIVGEASGDLHASNLMKALQSADSKAEFRFYGGNLMKSVGGTLVKHYKEMAYMGFVPVLLHLRTILKNMKACKRDIMAWKPDVLILVDYPGFNLDIAKYIRKHSSIPIYYYISPKIWAWKEHRIKNIRRDVDELFSILPFEVDFYQRHHYPIHYVGNPCVDAVEAFKASENGRETSEVFRQAFGLSSKPLIAVLAGSRRQEIKDNLRIMMQTAQQFTDYQFVIAGVSTIEEDYYRMFIPKDMDVKLVFDQTYRLLQQSEAALVTSGTATLETALFEVPQVVCYYTACGKLMNLLKRLILKVKYISLVNLIVDREIVIELIGDQMNTKRLDVELRKILKGGEARSQLLADYTEMRKRLGDAGASQRAAREIVAHLIG
ncbi:MAG: lipid-A-disaccharide synthase [Bacteroidaceae bacterium]|nr:lipid-A-disaccharide synthase [Bacteroidaceae bacterium]